MSTTLRQMNIGRTLDREDEHQSLESALHTPVGAGDAHPIWFYQELMEGDKWDERAMVRKLVREAGLQMHWSGPGREGIIMGRHWTLTKPPLYLPAASGAPGESPARGISEFWIERTHGPRKQPLVALTGHYATNVHNGKHGRGIDPLVVEGYASMMGIHRARINFHHSQGRDVVWSMDVNWMDFPSLHTREVVLQHRGPDHMRAIPAPGREVVVKSTRVIPMKIDDHDCLEAVVRFGAKRERRA